MGWRITTAALGANPTEVPPYGVHGGIFKAKLFINEKREICQGSGMESVELMTIMMTRKKPEHWIFP